MYEGDGKSILRCGQCNKPFDKQSTLKRHGYYCRSRRVGRTTRPRSCISCAKGKARCDNKRPECSRCITKAIECHYPVNTPKSTGPRIQHNDDALTEQPKMVSSVVAVSPSVENRQEASNNGSIIPDNALIISDLEFANLGGEYLDWDEPDIDFAEFLNPQMDDKTVQYPSSGSSSLVRHSTPSTAQTVQVQQAISSSNISIPTQPSYYTRRAISQRQKMKTGSQGIANLILHTLKSYPLMMMPRHNVNNIPPFIHPRSISSNVENNRMEPLTNCISLVHMISSSVQGSRKLFWTNVRLECERMCEEHLRLDKWELLAAMQALSIYIIIRLDEGETDHNNFDFLLLTAVTVIAKQLSCSNITCNEQSALCNYGLEISWKDWVFEESRRRICVVYQVVNLLVHFEPAAMCDMHTDLVIAPLPAKKQLWEADDAFAWKAEKEREPRVQTTFALAANGELVKLDESQLYCSDAVVRMLHKSLDARIPSKNTANWEEWCSGMDGLGGLIMLVASLIV